MKAATYVSAGNLQLLDRSSSPTTSNSQKLKKAYDVFKHVGESHALKVIIENDISE